jgi:hypothetical protein
MNVGKDIEIMKVSYDHNKDSKNGEDSMAVIYQTLPLKIATNTGSAAVYIATSSIGRKVVFTGTMYLAGGTIISSIGLLPVLVVGVMAWFL